MQNQNPNVNAHYKTLVVLWGALLISQFLLLVVVYFSRPEIFRFDFSKPLLEGENSVMIIAFAAIGITTFLLSFILKRKYVSQAIQKFGVKIVASDAS